MLLKLIRWLRGYVTFVIIGKFPERFINITSVNAVNVWDTQRLSDGINASMYISDYKRIRSLAKKSKVKLKIKSKHGLPFYIRQHKSRVGVLVGIMVFAVVVYIMSCFIWSVDVTGLNTVSYSELMSALSENGFYIGAYKPSLSYSVISRNTMLDIENIGWMSINVIGSHASVEVKEKAVAPKVDNHKQPCNVKASADGLIIRMETSQGKAYLSEGSGVVKGQLVVSGVVEDKLGGVKLVRANAKVIAKTTHKNTFTIPKSYQTVSPSGETALRKRISLFNINIPFKASSVKSDYSVVRYSYNNPEILDTVLPLSIITENVYAFDKQDVRLDESSAETILKKQSAMFEAFDLSKCKITDRKFNFSHTDSDYILNVTYDCEEDIAYQEDIKVDENAVFTNEKREDKEETQ